MWQIIKTMRKIKRKFKRLQRSDWKKMKDNLTLYTYIINKNNHIKGFYKDEKGTIYTHWLNDDEILDLESEVN